MKMQTPPGSHLILYDGNCGLCHRLVRFVLRRDRRGVFHFASIQGDFGRTLLQHFGGDPDTLTTFYIVTEYRAPSPTLLCKSRAALLLFNTLGGPWSAFGILRIIPAAFLDRCYDLIARNRYGLFGRTESCVVPDDKYKNRMI